MCGPITPLSPTTSVNAWHAPRVISSSSRCRPLLLVDSTRAMSTLQSSTTFVSPTQSRFSSSLCATRPFLVNMPTYTSSPAQPVLGCVAQQSLNGAGGTILNTASSFDPVAAASLLYENTYRLANMGSDYYSLVEPYYKAPTIPERTGFHMYSYSLDFFNLDPMGSTNYGKLTNVSLYINPSQAAVDAASAATLLVPQAGQFAAAFANPAAFDPTVYCINGFAFRSACASNAQATDPQGTVVTVYNYAIYCAQQSFEFVVTAVNNNIVRISGGALGFPVL